MTTIDPIALDARTARQLSEGLAAIFRTGEVGDVLADDVFLDGHPPFWRFQIAGRDAFEAWIAGYLAAAESPEVTVARTVPTATGFVTELVGRHREDGREMTDRKIALAEVRNGRIAELTVYCSGDWDPELRERHGAETQLLRP
jgi:ketosteroid isomerase-like protein